MAGFDGTFLSPYGAGTDRGYAQAVGQTLANAPSQFAQTLGNMYGSYNQGYGTYNQGLASLGNSYANNYAAMAQGMGSIANALGNTWNNAQSNSQAASAAEAARQAAVANLGTAAMANYGNVAGQGMQAWAQNQNGYQKSLSDMNVGNQNAISQLGVGRYNALAGLGKSGSALGIGQAVAGAIPGLAAAYGTGGTTAPQAGPVLGGQGYDMLSGLRGDINDGRELAALNTNYRSGLGSLNADQAVARNMPRTMMSDAYRSLMDFNKLNLNASSQGMDQFYDNYRYTLGSGSRPGQQIPTGSLLEALAGGYSDSANRIGGVQKDMNSGWSDAKNAYTSSVNGVNNLFDRTVGNLGIFRNAAQIQQDDWAMQDAARARQKQQEDMRRQEIAYGPRLAWSQRNMYGA